MVIVPLLVAAICLSGCVMGQQWPLGHCKLEEPSPYLPPPGTPIMASIPPMLYLDLSTIPGAGHGMFAKWPLRKMTMIFGPYGGIKTNNSCGATAGGRAWVLPNGSWVDAADEEHANWLVKVNSHAGSGRQPNLIREWCCQRVVEERCYN